MSIFWAWALLIVGLLIIMGLGVYIVVLLRELKRREALRRDEVRRAQENCLENLDVIARAMLVDQVDLVEGCLRCRVMIDIFEPELLADAKFRIFQYIADKAAHLHTHQAREALSPRERMQEDRERLQLTALNREQIRAGAQHVLALVKSRQERSHRIAAS